MLEKLTKTTTYKRNAGNAIKKIKYTPLNLSDSVLPDLYSKTVVFNREGDRDYPPRVEFRRCPGERGAL